MPFRRIFHLISMKCTSLFLLINFGLQSVLSDIRLAKKFFFLRLFVWNILFNPLPWILMCVFEVYKKRSHFQINFVHLYLCIGELRPLILRDFKEKCFWLLLFYCCGVCFLLIFFFCFWLAVLILFIPCVF